MARAFTDALCRDIVDEPARTPRHLIDSDHVGMAGAMAVSAPLRVRKTGP